MLGELRKRIERCRRFRNITRNGIVFDWELAGPNGGSYDSSASQTTQTKTSSTLPHNCARTTTWSPSSSLRCPSKNWRHRFRQTGYEQTSA